MRNGVLLAAFLLAAALVAWIGRDSSTEPAAGVGRTAEPSRAEEAAGPEPRPPSAARAPRTAPREEAAAPAEPAEPETPTEEPTTPEEPPAPDLDAEQELLLRVVDPEGAPVAEAEVQAYGMRREGDRGSWYGYRGGQGPIGRTDALGRLTLRHWTWVNLDGRATHLDILVTHPEFTNFRDSAFEIGPGERVVVLQRGATVVVSGWIETSASVVQDVLVHVDRDARLKPEDWKGQADGRLFTTQISPGPHRIQIEHFGEDGSHWFSRIETFELAEAAYEELHLELLPALRLRGELDPLVPRPTEAGHVLVSIQDGGIFAGDPSLGRRFATEVRADGTFELAGLPPGWGQVVALCRGWVSRRTEWPGLPRTGDAAILHPRIVLPLDEEPLVVEMEPTGSLEIRVTDELGEPLTGARAGASPNVQLVGLGSIILPGRPWNAAAGSDGVAILHDLPPQPSLWIHASAPGYRMRKEDRTKRVPVAILSGETTAATIVLERAD